MKLEKYLADYLEAEVDVFAPALQKLIKQGLDAFESTENVAIEITPAIPTTKVLCVCGLIVEIDADVGAFCPRCSRFVENKI